MRQTETRTHLPVALGVALLGFGFILIGSLAVPRANAETAGPPAAKAATGLETPAAISCIEAG